MSHFYNRVISLALTIPVVSYYDTGRRMFHDVDKTETKKSITVRGRKNYIERLTFGNLTRS